MRRVLSAIIVGGLVMTASAEGQTAPQGRPSALTVQANIVFLYYRDVPAAQRFYEDIIGLTLTVDQGFAKIYQVSPTSFIGLVDEAQGLHRASEAKAVTVSFVTERIDQWYEYSGLEGRQDARTGEQRHPPSHARLRRLRPRGVLPRVRDVPRPSPERGARRALGK